MKFLIHKTSESSCYDENTPSNDPPCYGAVYEAWIHTQTCDHTKLHSVSWWNNNGINHRVLDNGEWARDFVNYSWYIEIDTLEELVGLRTEVGHELIIQSDGIEIYDDYRE